MNDSWLRLCLMIIGLDFLFGEEDDTYLEEYIYIVEDC